MHPVVAQSALVRKPTPLGKYLWGSLAGHGLLVTVLLVANWLRAQPTIDLNQKPIVATLVRQGKPRDQKLLPRIEEPPPPPPPEVKPADVPAPPEAPQPEKVAVPIPVKDVKPPPVPAHAQKGQADAAKSKLFGAFSKFSKSTKAAEELEGEEDGDPNGDAAKAEGERYWGIISSQVRRYYDVSQTIPDEERIRLKANVGLRIGRRGEVISAKLAKASGNALFDDAVLNAVKKASPFPPPPEPLRGSLQDTGVVLEFTP